jgi:uncharacterized protein YprB with RNaseH-like and TPR domain
MLGRLLVAKWTDAERDALRIAGRDYHKFGELTGYSKSYDAFEVKSRRVNLIDPTLVADEAALTPATPHQPDPPPVVPRTGGMLGHKLATPDVVNFDIAYFDIEATDLKANFGRLLCMSVADQFGNVVTLRADDPKLRGERVRDDLKLAQACRDYLETFDIIVGWNSKMYDVPFIDSRLIIGGDSRTLRKDIMHVDPMWKAGRFSLALQSRRLDSVAQTFRLDEQKTPIEFEQWMDAAMGDSEALDYVVKHCEADVLTLRAAFNRLKPLIKTIHR